jgi:RNA polymerase sigma factor for flagellar operon FliA
MQKFDSIPENELWHEYQKTKSTEIRDYFVKKYSPLVKYVAGKVAISMPESVEYDDLISYGCLGLLDAIEKYNPEKEIQFKTYAITRVRGAIYDELRSIDWVPRSVRQKSKELENAIANLELRLGRSANDEEIAREMGMSNDEFQKLLLKLNSTSMVSLNEVWHAGTDEEMTLADSIESPNSIKPDVMLEKDEVKHVIIDSIKKLPDKERKVLILYYYEDLTLKEIGAVLEVTESRVSQLHTKAILRLRGRLTKMKGDLFT